MMVGYDEFVGIIEFIRENYNENLYLNNLVVHTEKKVAMQIKI